MNDQFIYKSLKRKITQLCLGLLCIIVAFIEQNYNIPYLSSPLSHLNGLIYDALINSTMHDVPHGVNVVVIDIDDESVEQEGRWPWPRDKMARLLGQLKKAGVLVVAMDIVMSQPDTNYALALKERLPQLFPRNSDVIKKIDRLMNSMLPKFDTDLDFIRALKQNDVVLGYLFQADPDIKIGVIPPPLRNEKSELIDSSNLIIPSFKGYNGCLKQLFDAAASSGFVSSIPDDDGILRSGLLVAEFQHQLYASLTLATVMRYLMVNTVELVSYHDLGFESLKGLKVGGIFIPTNKKGQILIPFFGMPGTVVYYSATDVIQGHLHDNQLAGSIAIIGSTMVLLSDLHPSPVSEAFPGVETTANMVSAILSQQLYSTFHWYSWQGLLSLAILGVLTAVLFAFLGPIALILAYVFFIFSLSLFISFVFIYHHLYIDITAILLMGTLQATINFVSSFQLERRQKNKIRSLFAQYVAPDYVKQLTDFPERYNMEGEIRNMTVFFADIRHFTSLSETLNATEVKLLLNMVFTPMTEIILAHYGTIDKYVGDMVMAFWGAPIEDLQHATHGIETALMIKKSLVEINQQLADKNIPTINMGMGISTGPMNVGDMGSTFRRAYTVIGDVVNIGARLQELTKFYKVSILTSEITRIDQDLFIWKFIDNVVLRGRHEAINIYEPLGYAKDLTSLLKQELTAYEEALDVYFTRDWLKAQIAFNALVASYPSSHLYQLYAVRITEQINQPTLPDWDGNYIHAIN